MRRTDPQVNVRIPAELLEALDREAASSGRSKNAEIVHRLEASLAGATQPAGAAFDGASIMAMLRDIQQTLDARPAGLAPPSRSAPMALGSEPRPPERDSARVAEHFRRWIRTFGTVEPTITKAERIDNLLDLQSSDGKRFIVTAVEVAR